MEDKFIAYQQNVFPGMLEALAERFKVSVDTIQKLGVGFNPDHQSWVFAERNASGEIIGLVERTPDNKKLMVKGSKRGLTYPLGKMGTNKKTYIPGKHNWYRATKQYSCPMCGKAGECLLSADNPADPSAVLCAHIIKGAVQHRATTHLHIRKESGKIDTTKPYPKSELPIIIVEGASDVLVGIELGFIAIGRPSAQGKIPLLAALLKNEDVIIIGENDEAGILGMQATANALQAICKSVNTVLPPDGIKDLRDWFTKEELTSAKLLEYVENNPIKTQNQSILKTATPLAIARQWYEKNYNGKLWHWRDDWWKYSQHCYVTIEEETLIQELYLWFEDKLQYNKKQQLVNYEADRAKIQNVLHALLAICHIENDPNQPEPFYINKKKAFNPAQNIIFKNGVYNIQSQELTPLTPQLFNTSTLPFGYDSNTDCPLWLNFVNDVFNKDAESIQLLQEWMGYNLIASNAMEKIMIFLGPPASGKSTVTDVMEAMLGANRTAAITLKTLDDQFGLSPLIGKYAAFLSEAYVSKRMDGMEILQRLKRITGRDTVNINRKYKSTISTKLFTRITYVANELPQFLDNPQALRRRACILVFPNSYEKNPDITLKRKLCKEAQGITNWAIKGLQTLKKNRKFITAKKSEPAIQELKYATFPLLGALDECCELIPKGFASKDQLYDICQAWLKENGHFGVSKIKFGRILTHAYTRLSEERLRLNGQRVRGYRGIQILPEAKERYLK